MTGGSFLDSVLASSDSEGVANVVDVLFDSRKARLKMITEIPPELIYPLAVLQVVQRRFKSKVLDDFAHELFLLQISRDRKGRGELIEALLAIRMGGDEGG